MLIFQQLTVKKFVDFIIMENYLKKNDLIIEIASNDGYLLKNIDQKQFKVLGVEPTLEAAKVCQNQGIEVINDFFDFSKSEIIKNKYGIAKVIVANNVIAHVPNRIDFLRGVSNLMNDESIASFEFHYLAGIILENQFDTIYHEHFSYFSLTSFENILEVTNLKIISVEKIEAQGGSLRVFCALKDSKYKRHYSYFYIKGYEETLNLNTMKELTKIDLNAKKIKNEIQKFFQNNKNKRIAAYGAAAKGNTILNYVGITDRDIEFIIDKSILKQGKFLPGSRIPILSLEDSDLQGLQFIVILPWNIKKEIKKILLEKKEDLKFANFIPKLEIT